MLARWLGRYDGLTVDDSSSGFASIKACSLFFCGEGCLLITLLSMGFKTVGAYKCPVRLLVFAL